MAKRKREARDEGSRPGELAGKRPSSRASQTARETSSEGAGSSETIQIITGSYDRVLHGFTATFDLSKTNLEDSDALPEVSFADTFMFNAHSSAIRCLALSPLTSEAEDTPAKLTLASGGSDERISLYSLSGNAPSPSNGKVSALPTLSSVAREENPKNREIGSLIHHSSNITQLCFATRSKLLSSSEDNTVAVTRTRDWTVLSTFKAPMPKILGRPSGDTAPPGGAPAGVNDFNIHPSMKIMISVGKGERSMRLWNLVTGKKAGVLDFDRDLLQAVGETKYATGEAQGVLFAPNEEGFVVSFDRGAVFYNMACQIQGLVLPAPRTKLHKLRFLPGNHENVLAVSTDDGRVLFFDTQSFVDISNGQKAMYKNCKLLGQLGGLSEGVTRRIKSFQVVKLTSKLNALAVVTACSDGSTRVWYLDAASLSGEDAGINSAPNGTSNGSVSKGSDTTSAAAKSQGTDIKQVGRVLGRYDTANRIVCMEAFKMLPPIDSDRKNDVERRKPSVKSRTDGTEPQPDPVEVDADDNDDDEDEDEFSGFD